MDLILDLLKSFLDLLKRTAEWLIDRFLELNIFDRLLVVSTVAAFFSIVLPVARYFIFDSWFVINNPLAVYMIGIVALVFGSFYIPPFYAFIIRTVAPLYYLGWVIYLHAAREISKAPYEITWGYWLNIAVPLLYTALAVMSFLFYGRDA